MKESNFEIRDATNGDIPVILQLIRDLATYERAPDDVVAREQGLRDVLFGREPSAKGASACENTTPVGFAESLCNFSTWLAHSRVYLAYSFVKAEVRRRG